MILTLREDLRGLVDSIDDLPSFPAAIQKATAIADDPDASAQDLADVIQVDLALTAKILRVTNSAFYGLSRNVSTVREAVMILGFSSVRSLAVAVSTMKMFDTKDSALFTQDAFWLHSTSSALVAQQLCQLALLPETSEAFTAALLHDVGKVVLDQYAHEAFMKLLDAQQSEKRILPETELRIINTTHSEIGRRLCEIWNLPAPLCEAIGEHHTPTRARHHPMLAMVAGLADYICSANGLTSIVHTGKPPDLSDDVRNLQIQPGVIAEVNKRFPHILEEARHLTSSD
ncbi:MAG: HDOD domain-containing protein [Planctomycetes bacterium]|nr:HDOD domain-containing protein [Planctomycetota bacterium]